MPEFHGYPHSYGDSPTALSLPPEAPVPSGFLPQPALKVVGIASSRIFQDRFSGEPGGNLRQDPFNRQLKGETIFGGGGYFLARAVEFFPFAIKICPCTVDVSQIVANPYPHVRREFCAQIQPFL